MAASYNAVSAICSHYGCEEMCEVSFTHHMYTQISRQELVLIRVIIF